MLANAPQWAQHRRPMLENPMVSGLARHLDIEDARDQSIGRARASLVDEFTDAFFGGDPSTPISTNSTKPLAPQCAPLVEVVLDLLTDEGDLVTLGQCVRVIVAAHDSPGATIAQGIVKSLAARYAEREITALIDLGEFA